MKNKGIVSNMKKIDRHFVSDFDKKMAKFNETHSLTPSQQFEKEKYATIYNKRDNTNIESTDSDDDLWDWLPVLNAIRAMTIATRHIVNKQDSSPKRKNLRECWE